MMREITVMELDNFHQRDPVDVCLEIWKKWSELKDQRHSMGYANEQDTKDFMKLGEAVEVMVDSLPRCQWWAVRKSQGLCTQWIFPEVSYPHTFQDAKQQLEPMMRKHRDTYKKFD